MRQSERLLKVWAVVLGWLFAALCATAVVPMLGFVGVGMIGAVMWYLSYRVELEEQGVWGRSNATIHSSVRSSFVREPARSETTIDQSQHAMVAQLLRFLRHLGFGLATIGLIGFAINQL